ncbi:unnamed protein product [marine sediment metagenome]|uniref:Uncharacterized protein n=1 Tax=marine sediment metagenome TaxID=412755 RepID=X1KP73_9ZZZZ
MSDDIKQGIADNVALPGTMEDKRHWQLRVSSQIIAYLKTQMKRTVIGEERSVPNKTEIYFLFRDELE